MSTPIHDGLISISFGLNRFDTSWQTVEKPWSEILKRLSKTTHTAETLKEFLASSRDRQDEIKDIGGFVGGVIRGGNRITTNVLSRRLLTFDLDYASMDFWDDASLAYRNAMAIYSTHKHQNIAPRLRLVMPLTRDVFPDEYEAIARKVAALLDIELFDPTTYQPHRLMYWPSTPKDQEYYYRSQDGPWLDPDVILKEYIGGWQDQSQWPRSSRENAKLKSMAALKQGDPTQKPGVIGAFCRCYSIPAAIDAFLKDVYLPTDDPQRYTYAHGSTGKGLVLYDDDTFCYSHHGTDPISGHMCNAFDLVRLHLFGKQDAEMKPDTPINKRASQKAMDQFAMEIDDVKNDLLEREQQATLKAYEGIDFGDENLDAVKEDADEENDKIDKTKKKKWTSVLKFDRTKKLLPTSENYVNILRFDDGIKNCIGYDLFTHIDTVLADLPWRKMLIYGEPFAELDHACLRNYVEKFYKVLSAPRFKDAFLENRNRVAYHPIKDYLSSLKWDGLNRVDGLLIEYFGAEDSKYVRMVTRKSIIACVARVFEPGIKFDNVLTLIGPEGTGKSTFLNLLGKEWYSNSLGPIDNPRIFEQLQGSWIIEIAELAGFKRADVENVKHFTSKTHDKFRVAYGTHTETFARQNVFFATTNTDEFLINANGNRRFWPVTVRPEYIELSVFKDFAHDVDQVWAEAVSIYNSGESLILTREVEKIAFEVQEAHTEYDEREDLIRAYLDTPISEMEEGTPGELRSKVSTYEIWTQALNGLTRDFVVRNTKEIHKIMARIKGWQRIKRPFRDSTGRTQKGYERVTIEK